MEDEPLTPEGRVDQFRTSVEAGVSFGTTMMKFWCLIYPLVVLLPILGLWRRGGKVDPVGTGIVMGFAVALYVPCLLIARQVIRWSKAIETENKVNRDIEAAARMKKAREREALERLEARRQQRETDLVVADLQELEESLGRDNGR